MPAMMTPPPYSPVEDVTEILHGVPVTDPYRWLEDQGSPRTRAWLGEQTNYGRAYLDGIPEREEIRESIREFLAVETYDSPLPAGHRSFFRKRLADQEQPCIYMREGADGEDQLLIDPRERGAGPYTAVKPLQVSSDGRLLLYEVKQGGESSGSFEFLDLHTRQTLLDTLPPGYLRGLVFAPDSRSFYYVHEEPNSCGPTWRAAYNHVLGASSKDDREVFRAGNDERVQMCLVGAGSALGFLVYHFHDKTLTDFYLRVLATDSTTDAIVVGATYTFQPLLLRDRILAITDLDAPNLRIVEVRPRPNARPEFVDVVAETELRIHSYLVAGEHLFVSYLRGTRTEVVVYNLFGERTGQLPVQEGETVRLLCSSQDSDEVFFEAESFADPTRIFRYAPSSNKRVLWAGRKSPFKSESSAYKQVWYTSFDGTQIPMFLFAREDVLEDGNCHPAVMTSYGGYGIPMAPQFSVLVSALVERGCLFALPNIRGGSEFGTDWYTAAKRQHRQTAYDDFLGAAEWLIETGHTRPEKLGIFGGSNSGLLVGAALTQRPDLFRAVLCMMPVLDMLRYHHFDNAYIWTEEYGTADNPEDFAALARYSPYHRVCDGAYPAVMLVSGDADRHCNPLHARKMTARLQAANTSPYPIFLDYSQFRGHSPVLPLTARVDALTDRVAFFCDQLQLAA